MKHFPLSISLFIASSSVCMEQSLKLDSEVEWAPTFYTELDGVTPQMKFAFSALPKLRLTGKESVLDMGCGDGRITTAISRIFGCTVHGIDISESMIETAKKHTDPKAFSSKYKYTPNASFEQASLLDYAQQTDKKYDVAVSFWTLYLFEDYEKALEAVLACLKPGGKALITHVVDPGTLYYKLFCEKIKPQISPVILPTVEKALAAIRKMPADIEWLELKYNEDIHPSRDALIKSMQAIPFFSMLPIEKEEEFYTELKLLYPELSDGTVIDKAHALYFILEKK